MADDFGDHFGDAGGFGDAGDTFGAEGDVNAFLDGGDQGDLVIFID
jgi:hypothetical protein